MRKPLSILLIILVYASLALADDNLTIKDRATVTNLVALQNEIDSLSDAVMKCLNTGMKHKDCMCANRGQFSHFSKSVKDLFAKYPRFEKQDLVNFKDPEGTLVNLSLVGIRRQASMNLQCSE